MKRILPPAYLLIAIVLMVALHLIYPIRRIVGSPYRYAGVILVACGLLLNVWASRLFELAGTTIKPFRESASLVVRGPYRVSRNPMYLGMVVALIGVAILAGSASPFLIVPIFILLIDRIFIRVEEADLERALGQSYSEYRQQVRRWL